MNPKIPTTPPAAKSAPTVTPSDPDLREAGNVIERRNLHEHHPAPPDRVQRIREAAYRRAEQRGFAPGAELEDWLAAEAEIDGKA